MEPETEKQAKPNHKPAPKKKRQPKEDDAPAPTEAGRRVLKTITEPLPVPMSKRELREMGLRLAQQEGELDNHESHSSQVKTDLKATEAKIRAEISAVSMALRNGTRVQDVPVALEADYDQGVVRYIRTDTKEEIRTRPLADEERQHSIFDGLDKEGQATLPVKAPPDITMPSGVTRADE